MYLPGRRRNGHLYRRREKKVSCDVMLALQRNKRENIIVVIKNNN